MRNLAKKLSVLVMVTGVLGVVVWGPLWAAIPLLVASVLVSLAYTEERTEQ